MYYNTQIRYVNLVEMQGWNFFIEDNIENIQSNYFKPEFEIYGIIYSWVSIRSHGCPMLSSQMKRLTSSGIACADLFEYFESSICLLKEHV